MAPSPGHRLQVHTTVCSKPAVWKKRGGGSKKQQQYRFFFFFKKSRHSHCYQGMKLNFYSFNSINELEMISGCRKKKKKKRNQPNYCTGYILCWVTQRLVYIGQNRITNAFFWGGGQHWKTLGCSSEEYKGTQDTISTWVGEKKNSALHPYETNCNTLFHNLNQQRAGKTIWGK